MVRPSKRPLQVLCPASAAYTQLRIQRSGSTDPVAGTAKHAVAALVAEGVYPHDAAARIHARTPDTDLHELEHAASMAEQIIHQLAPYLSDHFTTERRLEGPLGSGTTDLVSVLPDVALILDWKSREWFDAWPQLRTYGHCLRHWCRQNKVAWPGKVHLVLAYLDTGTYKVEVADDANLDAWEYECMRLDGDHTATFGEHCGVCDHYFTCSARRGAVSHTLAALRDGIATVEQAAVLYDYVGLVEKMCEDYRKALRAALEAEGELATGDGSVLVLVDKRTKHIDARTAWPVLQAHGFTEDDLAEVVTVKKTAVESVASRRAPKGEKGKAKDILMDALGAAGAVEVKVSQSITKRRG